MRQNARLSFTLSLIALVPLVSGCDSPMPGLQGEQHETVDVGGMTFGIHWTATEAEIYRTGWINRSEWPNVTSNAEIAVKQVTGCEVKSIVGDPALMTARLDCK